MSSGHQPQRRPLLRFWPLFLLVAFLVGAAIYSEGMKTRAQVGKLAPDFTLPTLEGTSRSLSDYRGRPVIVNFWATWCPFCRHEAPAHRAFLERFGDRVAYLALNLREPADKVRSYREEFAARGIPLLRTELLDRQGRIYDLYRATGTPETWIIDGEGRAVRHLVGPSRFEDLVAAVEETGLTLWQRPPFGWIYAVAASGSGRGQHLWVGTEEGVYALNPEPETGAGRDRDSVRPVDARRLPLPVKEVRSLSASPDGSVLWIVGQLRDAGSWVLVRWEGGQWQVQLAEDEPLAVAAGPQERVYAWTRARGFLASTDGGRSWQALDTPFRPEVPGVPLAVDPHHPEHLLSAGPGGLWQSRDGGRTWLRTGVEVPVSAIAFHPHEPGRVWFTYEEGVLVSRDGARTAQPLDGSPQRRLVGLAWVEAEGQPVPWVLASNGDVYTRFDQWRLVGVAEAPGRSARSPSAEGSPPPAGEVWVEGWETGAGLEVGQRAPDFLLPDVDGRWIRLSDLRGQRAVLINFWATWCPPCRDEMPQLEELQRSRGQELAVLAVNLRESPEQVESFLRELGLSLPVLLDAHGQVSRRYNIRPMPTSYFIDRQGIIRGRYFGYMPPQVLHGLVDLALAG